MLAGQPADRKCLALADADCGRYEERAGGERGRPTLGRRGVLRCHRYGVAKALTLASPDNTELSCKARVNSSARGLCQLQLVVGRHASHDCSQPAERLSGATT